MIQYDYSSVNLSDSKEQYKMSSVIAGDIFYYGLFDDKDNRLQSACLMSSLDKDFCQETEKFSRILNDRKLLNLNIKASTWAVSNPHFSILPIDQKIEDKEFIAALFSGLNFQDEYTTAVHKLEKTGMQIVYLQPSELKDIIKPHFENPQIISLNGALINAVSDLTGNFILFNFLNNKMQTVVIRNGVLLQSNDYAFKGKDDALYYALLNCKQFDFDPSMDQFYYAGTLPSNSLQLETFKQFFKYFDPLGDKNRLHYSNVFLGKEKHLFYDLDCVRLCV